MSGGDLDICIMNSEAEIHKFKSEYHQARSIHTRILQEAAAHQDLYNHGSALLNIAEIDVSIGAPIDDVQKNCEAARTIFCTTGDIKGATVCDAILADLYLREGNMVKAEKLFKECIKLSAGNSEMTSYCLECLGDASRWGGLDSVSSWTTVFLVHSLKLKEKLGIHKAVQFLGDISLSQCDEHTAISLFTVALEGFTHMDVHRSRAQCMLRLGDISKGHNNLLKAVELWETARQLFEWSSQANQVEQIDERLADVNKYMVEQHKKHLACLSELNVPLATMKAINDISDNNKKWRDWT
jgi:tetratricopeptide (TPR) repeat protein